MHVAAHRIEIVAIDPGRRADDLVIGEDAADLVGAFHGLAADAGPGAVGADHGARPDLLPRALGRTVRQVAHDGGAVGIAAEGLERPGLAAAAGRGGPFAQPFVEMLAIHHADETAVDRHVHLAQLRRYHAGRANAGHEEFAGDREIGDEPWRDGAAAGLDPPRLVEQHDAVPASRQVLGRRGARRAAAHHHHIHARRSVGPRCSIRRHADTAIMIELSAVAAETGAPAATRRAATRKRAASARNTRA